MEYQQNIFYFSILTVANVISAVAIIIYSIFNLEMNLV